MKTLKTKVIMSAIVLVFALIATIGSTYAWFTVSDTVTVNAFNITVESSESLLIRDWRTADGAEVSGQAYGGYGFTLDSFSSIVDLASSTEYSGYTSWLFSPVTCLTDGTAGETDYAGTDITNLRYLTTLNPATTRPLAAATANTSAGGYLELKFWLLRTSSEGANMNVAFNQTVTDGGATTYENAVFLGLDGDYGTSGEDISFSGSVITSDAGTDLSVFSDGDSIRVSGSTANSGVYTVSGTPTATAITVTGSFTAEDLAETIIIDGGNAQTFFGSDLDFGFAFGTTDAGYDTTLGVNAVSTSGLASGLAASNGDSINYLGQANVPELVTLYIWVEGWDADTDNDIMAATYTIGLTFSLIA